MSHLFIKENKTLTKSKVVQPIKKQYKRSSEIKKGKNKLDLNKNFKTNTKTRLGQFYTKKNPFKLKQFKMWFKKALKETNGILEPFAGSNNLIKMLKGTNYKFKSFSYDIEPPKQRSEKERHN